ncbi:MAG: histidine triad nucleotide-binding protein [Pseudomonadota bacterium]
MSTDKNCLFCKIIRREIPADFVYEDDEIVAFRDINPQAPVHNLFVPRRHIESANALTEKDAALMGRLVLAARGHAAEQGFADSGFRLVMNTNAHGCQTVFHMHLHLLGGGQLAGGFGATR